MSSVRWDAEIAEVYDETYAAMFEPSVLGPMADVLAELAGGGPALEFAIGTGRVALPLSARGIPVRGIELSPAMAERLAAKPGASDIPVIIGDMTTARVPGTFTLVYLVANTIMNVTTQDEQLAGLRQRRRPPGAGRVLRCLSDRPGSSAGSRQETRPGFSPSIPGTSGSRPSTTSWGRSRGPITGSPRAGRLVRHSAPYR